MTLHQWSAITGATSLRSSPIPLQAIYDGLQTSFQASVYPGGPSALLRTLLKQRDPAGKTPLLNCLGLCNSQLAAFKGLAVPGPMVPLTFRGPEPAEPATPEPTVDYPCDATVYADLLGPPEAAPPPPVDIPDLLAPSLAAMRVAPVSGPALEAPGPDDLDAASAQGLRDDGRAAAAAALSRRDPLGAFVLEALRERMGLALPQGWICRRPPAAPTEGIFFSTSLVVVLGQ